MGGIVEYVWVLFNGKIKFNEDLVYLICICYGYFVFLCFIDLYVIIESEDILYNVNILFKSLFLV